MQDKLDGNTAALNFYLREQERLDLLTAWGVTPRDEIAQDDLDIKIEELVVSEIEKEGKLAIEAIGTEATLASANEFHAKFKQTLLDSIKCKGSKSQDSADKDLGSLVRELVTDYIAGDFI